MHAYNMTWEHHLTARA